MNKYPFLAKKLINNRPYVVLFVEPDYGMVVANETEESTIKFGQIGDFDEKSFEVLSSNEFITLSN